MQYILILLGLFNIFEIYTANENLTFHTKGKTLHHIKSKHHTKQYNSRCWPQRCNIICPIQIQNLLPAPISIPTSAPINKTTQEGPLAINLTEPSVSPFNQTVGTRNGTLKQTENTLSQFVHRRLSDLLGTNRNHLNNLSNGHKRVLVKQFILGNSGGKKAYKFRQYAPFGCYVKCEELEIGPQRPLELPSESLEPNGPAEGNVDEEEEETDEPYHEGEDKPVEITVSPPDPNRLYAFDGFNGPSILLDKKKDKTKSHRHNRIR